MTYYTCPARRKGTAHDGLISRETPDAIFRMTGLILRMARNLHDGFHELFPPMEKPIASYQEQQERPKQSHQRR